MNPPSPGPETYKGLRQQILTGNRGSFSLPAPPSPAAPWGVVMDWGIGQSTVTVVALNDGTASVYISNGGGFIGGGPASETLRQFARAAVHFGGEVIGQLELTSEFPLPAAGHLIFYLLTDNGVFIARGAQAEFDARQHPLLKVGAAMQAIIGEYRKLQTPAPKS